MRTIILPLLLLGATAVQSQETKRLVSGQVISDESSAPVEGVTVRVKGTDNISGTQADGVYYINVGEKDSVLVFILDEYKTREVRISGVSQVDVRLERSGIMQEPQAAGLQGQDEFAGLLQQTHSPGMQSQPENSASPANSTQQEKRKPTVIEGVIYHDRNKNPVDKAYVFVTEGEEEYLTDKNGYFRIETWQKLPLQLTVKHDGKPASRYKVTDAGARQVIHLR